MNFGISIYLIYVFIFIVGFVAPMIYSDTYHLIQQRNIFFV